LLPGESLDSIHQIFGRTTEPGQFQFDVLLILELRDGNMWRDTRYYAELFEAPEWRAQWVEQMEP
jgi:hypothetical protein